MRTLPSGRLLRGLSYSRSVRMRSRTAFFAVVSTTGRRARSSDVAVDDDRPRTDVPAVAAATLPMRSDQLQAGSAIAIEMNSASAISHGLPHRSG